MEGVPELRVEGNYLVVDTVQGTKRFELKTFVKQFNIVTRHIGDKWWVMYVRVPALCHVYDGAVFACTTFEPIEVCLKPPCKPLSVEELKYVVEKWIVLYGQWPRYRLAYRFELDDEFKPAFERMKNAKKVAFEIWRYENRGSNMAYSVDVLYSRFGTAIKTITNKYATADGAKELEADVIRLLDFCDEECKRKAVRAFLY